MAQQTRPIGADVSDLMSGSQSQPIGGDVSSLMGAVEPTPSSPTPGLSQRIATLGTGVTMGAVKGLASTAIGTSELVNKILSSMGAVEPIRPQVFEAARGHFATPQTTAGKVGFGLEQIGEFLVPFGVATKAVSLAPKGGRLIRGVLRATGEGAEFGAKAAAQTGGDTEDVVTAALIGGATTPVSAAFKAAGKAFTSALPERLYSQVFKLAEDDWRLAMQAAAKGGTPNPTLAREVLERGLMGSERNMAIYSVKKIDALETQLQYKLAQKNIPLPQKQDFVRLLKDIESEMGGRFATTGKEAGALARKIRVGFRDRYVSATDALALKRFLDRARQHSSFRMSPKLSPKQEEYKQAADLVRQQLHSIHEASRLLHEERIFIEAMDAIVDSAVRNTNKRLLTLTDAVIGGGGMAAGAMGGVPLLGFTPWMAVRGFQQPFTLTGVGQGLHKLGQATPATAADLAARAAGGSLVQGVRK